MHPIFLLSWRYLTSIRNYRSIAIMMTISWLLIAISTCSIALIISIMNGFQTETYKLLQGIHADIIARVVDSSQSPNEIITRLQKRFPEIVGISPSKIQQILVTNQKKDKPVPVFLKGIMPEHEAKTTSLESTIITSSNAEKTLTSCIHDNFVIIGDQLASTLDVHVGDFLTIIYATDYQGSTNKIIFDNYTVNIGGIFKTGIEEFDEHLMVMNLELFDELCEDDSTHYAFKVAHTHDHDQLIKKISRFMKVPVYSWKSLYPSIVSAFTIERYAMWLILALISVIIVTTVVALLFIVMTYKERDIALLRSLGMSYRTIMSIFLLMGTALGIIGSSLGIVMAVSFSTLSNTYKLISLPDAYYISYLPIIIDPLVYLKIFAAIIGITIFASYMTVRRISSLSISSLLR